MEFVDFIKKVFSLLARFFVFFAIFYSVFGILLDGSNNNDFISDIIIVSIISIFLTLIFSFLSRKDVFVNIIIKISLPVLILSLILEGFVIGSLILSGAKGEASMAAFPLLIPIFLSFNALFIFLSFRKELWGIAWLIVGLFSISINLEQLYLNPNSRIYGSSFYSSGIFILSGLLFLACYFLKKNNKIVIILIIFGLTMGGLYFYVYNKIYYSIMTDQSFNYGWNLVNFRNSLNDVRTKIFDDYNSFFKCKLNNDCRANSLNLYIKDLNEFKNAFGQYDTIADKAKVQSDIKKYNNDLFIKQYDLFLELYNNYLVPIDSEYARHNLVNENYDKALKNNDLLLLKNYSLEGKDLQNKEKTLFAGLNSFYELNRSVLEDSFNSIDCNLNEDLNKCLKN